MNELNRQIARFLILGILFLGIVGCVSSQEEAVINPYPLMEFSQDTELHILSYNVYMRSPRLFFWNQQKKRTRLLPAFLRGYDVLVLQEVFGQNIREQLIDSLQASYPYHSQLLGKDGAVKQDGGLLVLSRWPLEKEAQVVYEDCAGADCLADKGAIYIKIMKGEKPYHIFATHTQASVEHRETRMNQFRSMTGFIQSQNISVSDPILIAGDLNVNMFANEQSGEFSEMLGILEASLPSSRPESNYAPTYDAAKNSLVNGAEYAYLDYVLYRKNQVQPDSSYLEVRIFQVGELDLSDHYAVYGYFSF